MKYNIDWWLIGYSTNDDMEGIQVVKKIIDEIAYIPQIFPLILLYWNSFKYFWNYVENPNAF